MRYKIMIFFLIFVLAITFTVLGFTFYSNRKMNALLETKDAQILALKTDKESLKKELLYLQSNPIWFEAVKVMVMIKNNDMESLASHVHPIKGLRISPWATISEKDQLFSQNQVKSLNTDLTKYFWGSGPGGDIQNTYGDYYHQYIYDHDFLNPQTIGINTIVAPGASPNNIPQFYPEASFVEFHFNGFNLEYEGLDWSSLSLIFIEENHTWYLLGIAHDNWVP